MDSFAALFEASITAGEFGKEGEIVKGIVVVVQRDNVIIDIGGKSEGMIALSEFHDAAGQVTVKAGDEIAHQAPRPGHASPDWLKTATVTHEGNTVIVTLAVPPRLLEDLPNASASDLPL